MNLALARAISAPIDPKKDLKTYDNGPVAFIKFLTINGNVFGDPVTPNAYWMSDISANGASRDDAGIERDTIDCDNYTYALSLAKYPDDGTKYDNGTGNYPTSPNAPHPDKATGSDTTSYVKNEGNTSTVTSAPTSPNNAALSWKKTYGQRQLLRNPHAGRLHLLRLISPERRLDRTARRIAPPGLQGRGNRIASAVQRH